MSVLNLSGKSTTGYATSNTTGEARVDVSQAVVLRFATGYNATNFGSGSINTTGLIYTCNMAVNGTAGSMVMTNGCIGFNKFCHDTTQSFNSQ